MRLDATPIGCTVRRPGMNGIFHRGGVVGGNYGEAGASEHHGRILVRSVLSSRTYYWPGSTDVKVVEP